MDCFLSIVDFDDVRTKGLILLQQRDDTVHRPDGRLDIGDDGGLVGLHGELDTVCLGIAGRGGEVNTWI